MTWTVGFFGWFFRIVKHPQKIY